MRTLLVVGTALLGAGCLSSPNLSLIEAGLSRQAAEGPYVAGVTERFELDVPADTRVTWSATGGALAGQNQQLAWTLPEGLATLSAELVRGEERVTREWHFSVEPAPRVGVTTAREALLAAPISVVDGGVETSGRACDLATDSSGAVHLAFTTSTHPSIFYGRWNGSSWTMEFVDGLGFNVGGLVQDGFVKLAVEPNGTPHLLYLRSDQLMWASKPGSTWLRERVDTDALSATGSNATLALNPTASNRPTVVYTVLNTSFYEKVAVAARTAANTWGPQQISIAGATWERVGGDAVFLGSNLVFPFTTSVGATRGLASWSGTAATYATTSFLNLASSDLAVASATRLVMRTTQGVLDVAVGTPFSASTFAYSASTISGAQQGDIAWNGSRPVVLQALNGSLELATPAADGYWTWTALGQTSGATAALALHPTTGVANVCYQANSRVMFQ